MNGSCFDLDRVLDILTVINPARFSKSYGNNNQLVSKTYSPNPSNRSAGSTMEARKCTPFAYFKQSTLLVCLFATEAIENIIGMYLCKYMQIAEVPSFIAHAQSYMIT